MLALVCLLYCAPPAELATPASWIWFPERPAVEGAGQTRYFRRTVQLEAVPDQASLRVLADDNLGLWINGQPAPEPVERGRFGARYDLRGVLRAGDNLLACAVRNAGGPGGLLVNGDFGGVRVFSDGSWRVSRDAPDGWNQPGFDDGDWLAASIVGNAFTAPWYDHPSFDLTPFLEPDDLARYQTWLADLTRVPDGLAAEPATTARLTYQDGHCVLRLGDQDRPPLIYRGTVDPLTAHGRRQIERFRDAGVHVYSAYYPLGACMTADGPPDYSRLDTIVRAYLNVDPEARLILILRLVPSNEWMDAHPDEMVGYAAGPDFNTSDEAGRVRRPSLASEPWRQDMGEVWRGAIEHLEAQPWGKRIIGYHPGYGIYTEWHYFGSWQQQAPDTGSAMTRWFRAWLRRQYGDGQARLRAAWQSGEATFENAAVPGVDPRLAADALGLRNPANRQWVIDYYRCQQELTWQRVEEFCRFAKEATAGRDLAGAFYGYYQGVLPQTQGGHLELDTALRSPLIDYFAAPYSYSHRLMGDDGRTRAISDAFPLSGKVHMIEADTRTWLHPRDEYGRAPDADSSVAAIRREVGTALVHHSALWWCDFGADGSGGWYDDDRLIGQIKELTAFATKRLQRPTSDVAEVALIADPESCYYLPDGEAMRIHYTLVDQVSGALSRSGAPFDFLLLSELPQADVARYKVMIFLDPVHVDADGRTIIKRAVAGKSVVWLWAPGITDGERFGPELVTDLTGFGASLPPTELRAEWGIVEEDDPLTAGLPELTEHNLNVTGRAPITAAGELDNWYNPRDAETMTTSYTGFEVTAADGGIDWRVGTTAGWSDVHLRATVPVADGLGLTVSGSDGVAGTAFRLVIKDADSAEFAAPLTPVTDQPTPHEFPLAAFDPAPWYRGPATSPRLPLTGFKVVLYGLNAGRLGTLHLRALQSLRGTAAQTRRRIWAGPGMAQPCLVLDGAGGTVLARAQNGAPLVVARGARGQRQVFSALASLPIPALTALLDEAGVHRFVTDPAVLLQADADLLVLHSAEGGTVTVQLPRAERLVDGLSGEALGEGTAVELSISGPGTRLVERQPVAR